MTDEEASAALPHPLLVSTRQVWASGGTITCYAAAWRRPDGTLVRHGVVSSEPAEAAARRALAEWAAANAPLEPIAWPS